ncbi:MAG TPA: stage II sporulation protein M [Clostridia bacterium]|nr:stage II sporulation protein M [Clostridia bacterium]
MERERAGRASSYAARRKSLVLWIRIHWGMLFFGIMFLLGVLIGTAASVWLGIGNFEGVTQILKQFVLSRENQSMMQTFFSALTPNAAAWFILLICGFCAVSAPIIALTPCVKGMGYGVLASGLLTCYPDAAMRYISVFLLPNLMISTVTIMFCCCDAMQLSQYFWQSITPQQRGSASMSPGVFCGKMVLYGMFLIAGAALEAYSYALFR